MLANCSTKIILNISWHLTKAWTKVYGVSDSRCRRRAVNEIVRCTRWPANKRQQRLTFRWITVRRQTDQQSPGKWVLSTDHRPPGGLLSRSPPSQPFKPVCVDSYGQNASIKLKSRRLYGATVSSQCLDCAANPKCIRYSSLCQDTEAYTIR